MNYATTNSSINGLNNSNLDSIQALRELIVESSIKLEQKSLRSHQQTQTKRSKAGESTINGSSIWNSRRVSEDFGDISLKPSEVTI